MEEMESIFQHGTTQLKDTYSNDPAVTANSHQNFEGPSTLDPTPEESKQESKLLENDEVRLELHQICRGCLNITDVSNMQDKFFDGITCVMLYTDITKIKVDWEKMPAMMCANCILELGKIFKFIKILKHSYLILENATNEIQKLNKLGNIDMHKYSFMKTNILINALKDNFEESAVEDTRHNEVEGVGADRDLKISDDRFSDDEGDNFSIHNDSASSDDEIPLSERFKVTVNKEKEDKEVPKKSQKKNVNSKKTLPKRVSRKSKENLENLPDNITSLSQTKLNNESQIKERREICPICLKKFRHFAKHMQSVHNVDCNDLKCLKCSNQNAEKDKLVEHCKECLKIQPKDEDPDYVDAEELKVEWHTDMVDEDDCDPDFEIDDVDRNLCKDNEEKEDVDESRKYKRKNGKSKKYTCNRCEDISYSQYEAIEYHLKEVHSTDSECIICSQEFTNSFSLLYHMMVKHGKLKCCRLCLVSFKNSDELSAHYKSDEHNTKCTVCGEQFKNRKALYEHRRKKHLNPQLENQKYKCPECPKEFANQNNIRRHIMVSHNDLRFLCDTCGQSYTTKRNLKLHIQKFHEGVQVENKNTKKNFFCEACGRELKIFHKYAIAMHRAKHKGHNFVCKKCYDSFATEEDFKKHVEKLGHQLYECDKCQSQFVREENFKLHLKNHDAPGWNKNMFATWGKSAKLRNEKGEFVCSYCPKVFKDKQRLDNHVRVHTNERPYKCHICSKGFKTWIHRKTHLNIHLGIKKWVCKFCSKAFTNSCTLKGHEMIHTGERPHRCPECKKGFITMSAMKKHRMVHFRTTGANYEKKEKRNPKHDEKTDSEPEENAEFIYKYGQMFTGSDVSYESFTESKEPLGMIPIEKEMSC